MTGNEITLIAFLWIAVGLWICKKRNYYPDFSKKYLEVELSQTAICIWAIILMPFNLLVVFCKEFIFAKWSNQDFTKEK